MSLMSLPVLPMPYQNCRPEEKLRRLRVSYSLGRITFEELDKMTEEAVKEQDEYERKRDGLNV